MNSRPLRADRRVGRADLTDAQLTQGSPRDQAPRPASISVSPLRGNSLSHWHARPTPPAGMLSANSEGGRKNSRLADLQTRAKVAAALEKRGLALADRESAVAAREQDLDARECALTDRIANFRQSLA